MTRLTEDRLAVRTHLDVNMVVEAGAGTGKTTLLIERLCFALLAQGITAPRLVALTFTEKAAAEIKTRLIFKLQSVLRAVREKKDEPVLATLRNHFAVADADIVSRAELALAQLDRSQIGTIHSFCSDILRMYPLEAGLTPSAEIDKGPRAQRLLDGLWNRFLDEQLGENAPRREQWKAVLSQFPLTDLYACVREMCSGKVRNYEYSAQKAFLATVCQERAEQAAQLSGVFLEGKKKPRIIEQALQQASRRFMQAKTWLETGLLPAESEETILIKSIPKDWDESSVEQAKALCRFAAQADPFVQTRVLQAYELLAGFTQEVRNRYAEAGILSFDDLLVKARDLLQHNLLVRRLLQEKYDAIYIDEFQDTDPAQGELLLYLAERKGNGATNWREVVLEPGKLFVVGDPKQSIYRFRGADITAYELFTDLILNQGGEKAYLRQNFRSEPEIIALTNEVCSAVMREKPAFQPGYEAIFTAKKNLHGAAEMALVCTAGQKVNADNSRHNQAEFVAHWIKQNIGKMTLVNGRKLKYGDIAILSRAATTLRPYTDALRRHGIAFAIEEDRDFYRRQEVSDFLNILRVLDDPQDRISLVGVMRSPLGALSDDEIYQAAQRKELNWRHGSSDEKLERLFKWLRKLAAQAGRQPLREVLHSILQESFLAEACALAYDGQRSISNLQRLVSLAEGYSLQTPATLGQFLARVQELMEQELGKLTALSETESMQAVSVMTVHKSKGLEFPVVILVDISKKEVNTAAKRAAHLYSWQKDLHGFRIGKCADINLAWLEEEQREHSRCEEVRILYVALTRAREKLLIVGNEQVESGTLAAHFVQAGVFPPEEEQPSAVGKSAQVQVRYLPYVPVKEFIYATQQEIEKKTIEGDLAAWRTAYEHRRAAYLAYTQERGAVAPSALQESQTNRQDAMQLGNWIHAALVRRRMYLQESAAQAVQAVAPQASAAQQTEMEQVLNHLYASSTYQKIVSMQLIGAEFPFSIQTANGVVSGVIDLLLRDKTGTVWVVDYKTDQVPPGQEPQAAQKYAAQLAVYEQAAQKLYPSARVQTAVLFVRSAVLIKLSAGATGH